MTVTVSLTEWFLRAPHVHSVGSEAASTFDTTVIYIELPTLSRYSRARGELYSAATVMTFRGLASEVATASSQKRSKGTQHLLYVPAISHVSSLGISQTR